MYDAHVSLYQDGVYWKKLVLRDISGKTADDVVKKVTKYLNSLSYEFENIRVFKKDPA